MVQSPTPSLSRYPSTELAESGWRLETAKKAAQQQAAEMAALLARYQEQFGDLPEGSNRET